MFYLVLLITFFFSSTILSSYSVQKQQQQQNNVTVALSGQFGNQLFEIATAYAYALDNNVSLTIPDLIENKQFGIPYTAKRLFLAKIPSYPPPLLHCLHWTEPSFNYTPIPKTPNIALCGYFQSEKYFKHRRQEILELFAAPPEVTKYLLRKYPILSSDDFVVGIQIRDYRKEFPTEEYHPTIKRSYYQKAIAYFPENTTFLVSSNNLEFAKECVDGLTRNIIFLEENDYLEDFYALVLCKSFIISNSTFGWWASWLCTNEDKIVITPDPWWTPPYDNKAMKRDLLPQEYLVMEE